MEEGGGGEAGELRALFSLQNIGLIWTFVYAIAMALETEMRHDIYSKRIEGLATQLLRSGTKLAAHRICWAGDTGTENGRRSPILA